MLFKNLSSGYIDIENASLTTYQVAHVFQEQARFMEKTF